MEVEYVVKSERKDLAKDKDGHDLNTVYIAKGHTIIKVPCITADGSGVTSTIKPFDDFKKPEGVEGYFRITAWENGGADPNSGKSEIVCSIKGEKLKPVRIIRRKENANKEHALFTGKSFVIVGVSQHRNNFTVNIIDYQIDPQTGIVESSNSGMWELGYCKNIDDENIFETMPESIKEFKNAIKAAMTKSCHYRCVEPHYFNEKKE